MLIMKGTCDLIVFVIYNVHTYIYRYNVYTFLGMAHIIFMYVHNKVHACSRFFFFLTSKRSHVGKCVVLQY